MRFHDHWSTDLNNIAERSYQMLYLVNRNKSTQGLKGFKATDLSDIEGPAYIKGLSDFVVKCNKLKFSKVDFS